MEKSVLQKAAVIYAAAIVRNSLGTGALFFSDISNKDQKYFQLVIKKIADGLSTENATSLEDAIEIASKNESLAVNKVSA